MALSGVLYARNRTSQYCLSESSPRNSTIFFGTCFVDMLMYLSVCWQAHRGYPFCSRRSEADDHRRSAVDVLRPTIHNRRQSGTTLRPETCPKYIKTTRNQEKQYREKTGPPSIVNSRFCTCPISGTTKATTFKLCSVKDYYTTTPQKRFHGSSPFRSPVIKLDTLQKTRKSQKMRGPARR